MRPDFIFASFAAINRALCRGGISEMKRPGEGNVRSCFLFAALMLAAVVMTCVVITWALYPGAGLLALAPDTSSNESPASDNQTRSGAAVNRPAPDFTLTDLDGKQVSLTHFSGRPVVLNFWATWCTPCEVEIPHLIEAYEREQGEVVFLAISLDEPKGIVRRFAEANAMPFTILLDGGGKVASNYRVRSIPTTFFISREGEVVARYVGQMSPHRIEEGLSRIR